MPFFATKTLPHLLALAITLPCAAFAQQAAGAFENGAPPTTQASDPASLLSENLRLLSRNPYDVDALTQAGLGALAVDDPSAAMGFLARAEELSPGNARIKAALGSALAMSEKPDEALSLFSEAVKLGASPAHYAADRGLAYDLKGENRLAQRDYDLALRYANDDRVVMRLALSLGITGDRDAALAQLTPLLRKNDQAAWRARAFILAMNGQIAEAERIANDATPGALAGAMNPFLERLARLTPSQKAHAVNFGTMPSAGVRYAIAETSEPFRPVAAAPEPVSPKLDKTVADVRVLPPPLTAAELREAKRRERREKELVRIAERAQAAEARIPVATVAVRKEPALMPQTQAVIDELLRPKSVVAEKRPETITNPEPPRVVPEPQIAKIDPPVAADPPPVFEVQPTRKVESIALPPSGAVPPPITFVLEPTAQAPVTAAAPVAEVRPGSRLAALLDGIEVESESEAVELPAEEALKAIRVANRKKAEAEAKAAAIKAAETKKIAEEKAAAKKHPARYWVQVATGANRSGLPGTWKKLQSDASKTLTGLSAASVPFKSTNRLLVGPFKSEAEARALVNKLAKEGKSASTYASEAGQEIAKIGGK